MNDSATTARAPRAWLSRNVIAVGVVSLLTDASSEMVLPLLPAFLTGVLGGGAMALGWIEGLADAVASALKLYSGQWADRLGRDRPLMLLGYGISTVARPFVAFALAPWHVLAVRVTDRMGKGIRSSPRDALLSKAVPVAQRGAAFGFHRAMDHAGAVIGPALAFLVLSFWTSDLRTLFLLSAIPGALAVLAIVLGVREAGSGESGGRAGVNPAPTSGPQPAALEVEPHPVRALLPLLLPLSIYTLGNASETFLLLKAGTTSSSLTSLPLLWIGLHLVKSGFSVVGGLLADRFGRRRIIALGWGLHAACYVALAFATAEPLVWALFILYGVPVGLSEGPEKALVSTLAPKRGQGAGFGWYHLTLGVSTLLASVMFGTVWDLGGARAAFLTAAAFSAAGLALFVATSRYRRRA